MFQRKLHHFDVCHNTEMIYEEKPHSFQINANAVLSLQKNALQWTKTSTESETPAELAGNTAPPGSTSSNATAGSGLAPDGPSEATEQESCDSTETTAAASGDNDGNSSD